MRKIVEKHMEYGKTISPNQLSPPAAFYIANYYPEKPKFLKLRLEENEYSIRTVTEEISANEVLGYFANIKTLEGSVLLAYFASSRTDGQHAPDYRNLNILVGTQLVTRLDLTVETEFSIGTWRRRLTFRSEGRPEVALTYWWPFYKEGMAKVLGDPFNFVSSDFCSEVFKLIPTK